jgi:glucose-6-phosphate isomerase
VISAGSREPLVFGAWCDRDYGFEYEAVRARGGLAWFPVLDDGGAVQFRPNANYVRREIEVRLARRYPELGLEASLPLYDHLPKKPDAIQWVSEPQLLKNVWPVFEP